MVVVSRTVRPIKIRTRCRGPALGTGTWLFPQKHVSSPCMLTHLPLLQYMGVSDCQKQAATHMCYRTKFRRSRSNHLGERKGPKNFGDAASLGMATQLTPRNIIIIAAYSPSGPLRRCVTPGDLRSPRMLPYAKFSHSTSNRSSVIEICRKALTPRSYQCFLVTMGLSRTVFEITGNTCKCLPLTRTFYPHADWFFLEFVTVLGSEIQTDAAAYQTVEKV